MPCAWDATEFLLKASLMDKEDALLHAWIRGYTNALECFPRLHVVTGSSLVPKARALFAAVPNATVRENAFPPAIETSGTYHIIQWHCLWADNFTTAPYVFFMDVDAVPVLPLRCHHFFDDSERVLQYAFRHAPVPVTAWVKPCSDVFLDAQHRRGESFPRPLTSFMAGLDFMNFWPIVAPRWALPRVRELVTRAYNASCFDEAFVAFGALSHADLIGKTLLTSFPERAHIVVCPHVHNRSARAIVQDVTALDDVPHHYATASHGLSDFACRDKVAVIEHVRHPLQGLHSPDAGVKFKPYFKAAEYAHELINESLRFRRGDAGIPSRLFHYNHVARNASRLETLAASLLDRGPVGRVCGVGAPRREHERRFHAGALEETSERVRSMAIGSRPG